MQRERDGLTLAGELLRAALASTEHSVEAARSAVAVTRQECARATAEGTTFDEMAVALGVSRQFVEAMVSPTTTEPFDLLNAAVAGRLRFVLSLQPNQVWAAAGLLGCMANADGVSLLWHRPDPAVVSRIEATARELGVSVTHDDFPAGPQELQDAMRTVLDHVGVAGIRETRLSTLGVTISIDAPDVALHHLQSDLPDWVVLQDVGD